MPLQMVSACVPWYFMDAKAQHHKQHVGLAQRLNPLSLLSDCRLQHPWSIGALICLYISRMQPSTVREAGTDGSQQASVQVREHSVETLMYVSMYCLFSSLGSTCGTCPWSPDKHIISLCPHNLGAQST